MKTTLKFAAALALLGFCLSANAQEGGKMAKKDGKMMKHDAKMHKAGAKHEAMKMEGKKEEAKESKKMEKMEEKGKM